MRDGDARMIVHAAPWVVPISAPPIRDGAVALDGDRVAAVGPRAALSELGEIVEHHGVIMPGTVNAHTHLELSHVRVPGGDGLVPWVRRLLASRTPTNVAIARAAAKSMAARGTVGVVDISNDGGTAPIWAEAGIEARVLTERIAPRGEPAPSPSHGRETPHATYSCGPAALRTLAARNGGRLASIHVEEDPAEAAWLVDGGGPFADFLAERDAMPTMAVPGVRPIAWLDSLGVLGPGTLLVHLTVADAESLDRAARYGCIAVLCPRSNLHIGRRLPPTGGIRAAGLRVALGTDSLASCPTLDVLGDVQALARAGVEPEWLVRAATAGGATALNAPHLGALSVGKQPGLIALGDDQQGVRDPFAWIAHEGADAPVERIG
ncbi:MAG TPA: amidohydrolase family protein [Polyangia bacterium]|nr:amidohydrolase family protein [Polyangia bacterium]